jgi:hypothetical protein
LELLEKTWGIEIKITLDKMSWNSKYNDELDELMMD